ncbi:phosphopantetheine-binding protein [Micromonospora olivasterospora]|uniref:Acyl carrier protein n=1 Tax=Micromonospora olivasterospora TaxID=1880 RepID=A0A562I2R1_MICOL|nr:phosphopantetheine-binding protein [Micromonospora olivasterospora]TWH65086.1 acyl carrier protein [Micromonospora olivasterospora]
MDGAEAFRRSLTAGLGAQVVITTRSVADIRRRAARVTTETLESETDPAVSAQTAAAGGSAAPRTELEAVIAQVWRDGLGVPVVGVDDDFFALGGNSLVAVQLIAAMRKATGVRLPMRSLFETPTVAGWPPGSRNCAPRPPPPTSPRLRPRPPASRGCPARKRRGCPRLSNRNRSTQR